MSAILPGNRAGLEIAVGRGFVFLLEPVEIIQDGFIIQVERIVLQVQTHVGQATCIIKQRAKRYLLAGIPSMFEFTVFESIREASTSSEIPFPTSSERRVGGHAVVACGFDDRKKIKNSSRGGGETIGAIMIRNSWREDWGVDGYGYLPYDYVLNQQAVDWWTVLKSEWVDTGQFKFN